MELQLSPAFYMQVSSTSPQTMAVLPSIKKAAQKIVVGDHSGVVTCFKMKKGDPTIVFKTLPGSKLSRLKLSGSEGNVADKIFVSSETEVRGFLKKGKQFLAFDTNLTEPIHSMWVQSSHLVVCGPYVYNHYVDCKDTDYYLCSDKINDVLCLPSSVEREFSPILACQDCSLRLLKGSELLYEVEVAGPPLCVALNGEGGGEDGEEVLYGTESGRMGLVKLQPQEPSHRWDMLNERKYGGISCLATSDLTGDGVDDIVVGRDDGVVEVYSVDEANEPRLKFTHVLNESVTSVGGGVVSSAQEEVVVCTYSGRIIGLTREPLVDQAISQEVQAKLEALRQEVEGLEAQVGVAKEQYQQTASSAKEKMEVLSALPQFPINDKFVLNQDEAWYTLSIELQSPIDTVVLQSNVPVDLQEVDKSSAVVSYSPPDPESENFLLATFRCHDTTRLEVKVRSIEGHQGNLQAYITPRLEPKTCRLRQYPIKPLSLHQRMHSFDETRPCNTLRLTGQFSLGEAHSWVAFCLPNISEQPPVEDVATLYFKSTFIDSQLECCYRWASLIPRPSRVPARRGRAYVRVWERDCRKGEVVFRSDNMSTISVLKEVLSKETAQRKMSVRITHELDDSSVEHMLRLIYPQLEAQLMLAKNVQLIEGLQEIQIHEQDSSCLSPQCQYILENASAMQEELKQQPAMIERLYAIVTDLYIDRASFKGQNVHGQVPQLMELMDNCDLDSLIQFFSS